MKKIITMFLTLVLFLTFVQILVAKTTSTADMDKSDTASCVDKTGTTPDAGETKTIKELTGYTTLKGLVLLNGMEKTHYELISQQGCFVLVGDIDFKIYMGKTVEVSGTMNQDQVSIWMKPVFTVTSIKINEKLTPVPVPMPTPKSGPTSINANITMDESMAVKSRMLKGEKNELAVEQGISVQPTPSYVK